MFSLDLVKRLPLLFGCIHAVFVAVVFGSAINNPVRAGLLPIFAYAADFPLSVVFEFVSQPFQAHRWLIDALIYLIFGSLWFYFLGWIVAWFIGAREV